MPDRKFHLPAWIFSFSGTVLQKFCLKISHGLQCLTLHLPGGVSICSERKSAIIVAQHTADSFHIQGGPGVRRCNAACGKISGIWIGISCLSMHITYGKVSSEFNTRIYSSLKCVILSPFG